MKKVLVLLSGGLDSAVCLAHTLTDPDVGKVKALTFDYNQSNSPEIAMAVSLCGYWKVPHEVLKIDIPFGKDAHKEIPARNLIFLSFAAGYAISHGYTNIVIGAEPDSTYTDSSTLFLENMVKTLALFGVALGAPVKMLAHKKAVVETALDLGVPLHLIHSSLGPVVDGSCATSARFIKAVTDILGGGYDYATLFKSLRGLLCTEHPNKVFYIRYGSAVRPGEVISFKLAPALFTLSAYKKKKQVDSCVVHSTGNWRKAIKHVADLRRCRDDLPTFTYVSTKVYANLLNQELNCGSKVAQWGIKQALSLLPRPKYAPRLACRVVQGNLAKAARDLGYEVVTPQDKHDILLETELSGAYS